MAPASSDAHGTPRPWRIRWCRDDELPHIQVRSDVCRLDDGRVGSRGGLVLRQYEFHRAVEFSDLGRTGWCAGIGADPAAAWRCVRRGRCAGRIGRRLERARCHDRKRARVVGRARRVHRARRSGTCGQRRLSYGSQPIASGSDMAPIAVNDRVRSVGGVYAFDAGTRRPRSTRLRLTRRSIRFLADSES